MQAFAFNLNEIGVFGSFDPFSLDFGQAMEKKILNLTKIMRM